MNLKKSLIYEESNITANLKHTTMKTNFRKLALILQKVDASKFFSISVYNGSIVLGAFEQDVLIDNLNINWDSIEYDLEMTIFKKNNVKLIVS